jgi:hypothetical protein
MTVPASWSGRRAWSSSRPVKPTSGFVVVSAPRGDHAVWVLRATTVDRPSPVEMRHHRSAYPQQRVRVLTDAQWDELPRGRRDIDWVSLGDRQVLR